MRVYLNKIDEKSVFIKNSLLIQFFNGNTFFWKKRQSSILAEHMIRYVITHQNRFNPGIYDHGCTCQDKIRALRKLTYIALSLIPDYLTQ